MSETETTEAAEAETPGLSVLFTINDFKRGDKIRHSSYPPGVYAVVGETVEGIGTSLVAYGFVDPETDEPVETTFLVNEKKGGMGEEWEAVE